MTDDTDRVAWSDVDDDADRVAEYLDTVTGLDAIEEYKRRSHRLLEPEPGDRLLDVGCGLGDDVLALADHVGPDGEVVGIDRSESLIADARERADGTPAVSFRVGDALDLASDDDAVDGCRTDRVLQHLSDPTDAVIEMCRVTRPGCRVTMSEPNWRTFGLHAPGVDRALTRQVTDERWANVRNPTIGNELYSRAREAGLTDLEVAPTTVVLTDLETVNRTTSLERRLEALEEADVVSGNRARQWLDGVRRADALGTLLISVTVFTVAGTVPTA